jgi:tRNA-uridine 2-sulfurtransferase
VVVQGHDHPWLLADQLTADDASWVSGDAPAPGARLTAKTRYRQTDARASSRPSTAPASNVAFDAPQWAATPGQSAVLYDGEVCLGGGVIESRHAG